MVVCSAFLMLGSGRDLGLPAVVAICLVVVVPVDVIILGMRWRADARFDAVTAISPRGYVVEGLSCNPTTAALFRVGGVDASKSSGRGFAVVFDADGARFYVGARSVRQILSLSWSQMTSIDTETVSVNNREVAALTIMVACGGGSTVLPIVIKATKGVTGFQFSSSSETLAHVQAVQKLRGNPAPTPRISANAQPVSRARPVARRERLRGLSSREMVWLALIGFLIGMVGLFGMLPFGILTWTNTWDVPSGVFMPFILVGLISVASGGTVLSFVPLRQSAETRAGYTLFNSGDTNLDLIDAKTGYVIRPGGHEELSTEELKDARHRARLEAAKISPRRKMKETA
ncbi:hypothetical protein ACX9R5_03260 [Rathayibacter sp. CAU 1779]